MPRHCAHTSFFIPQKGPVVSHFFTISQYTTMYFRIICIKNVILELHRSLRTNTACDATKQINRNLI